MRKALIFFFVLALFYSSSAQVKTTYYPDERAYEYLDFLNLIPEDGYIKEMPIVDNQELSLEDNMNNFGAKLFKFGYDFNDEVTIKDGSSQKIKEGLLWSLRIKSNGAFSMNFIFKELNLSQNAELYIVNSSKTMVYGPVKS